MNSYLTTVYFENKKIFSIVTQNKPHGNFDVWAKSATTPFAKEINSGTKYKRTDVLMEHNEAIIAWYDLIKEANKNNVGLNQFGTKQENKYHEALINKGKI
ncbi:hypothetical protein [Aeromonas veronii]|uniref:hypothetical protein n=1 Tax=Aeromonas veronii TaxID=654 RepID=UPI00244414B8|nr:hypothetical protein [Aeromonas veronii]